jgi:hypothetical protein
VEEDSKPYSTFVQLHDLPGIFKQIVLLQGKNRVKEAFSGVIPGSKEGTWLLC